MLVELHASSCTDWQRPSKFRRLHPQSSFPCRPSSVITTWCKLCNTWKRAFLMIKEAYIFRRGDAQQQPAVSSSNMDFPQTMFQFLTACIISRDLLMMYWWWWSTFLPLHVPLTWPGKTVVGYAPRSLYRSLVKPNLRIGYDKNVPSSNKSQAGKILSIIIASLQFVRLIINLQGNITLQELKFLQCNKCALEPCSWRLCHSARWDKSF